ncbi:MAG TPA: energy transducer TonB [Thermoanaerobaculia bacterium]|nr:energy transducer TonB [Thermoanaerobaculia bacterium]
MPGTRTTTLAIGPLGLALVCLAAAPALRAQAIPAPRFALLQDPHLAPEAKACNRCNEVDQLLRRGDWAAAESAARAEIAEQLREKGNGKEFASVVAQLAVAEVGQGRAEDGLWHWQAAQRAGSPPDLADYGKPGELLTKSSPRLLGQAPSGGGVRREGDGGSPLTPARRISGADAELSGAYRNFPRGIKVEVVVDREGQASQPVVAASTFPALTYVVLEALRGWRFTPAQAGGEPVAALYVLEIPERRALDRLADFRASPLAKPLAMLEAGRYRDAEKALEKIWSGALDDAEQTRAFLGVALALKALAEAGLGRDDPAICRFQAAQTLEPRLYNADLSAFGAPGALLTRHPWVAPEPPWRPANRLVRPLAGASDEQVTKPEILSRRPPFFPGYARRLGIQGAVVISSVISETGALRDVALWQPSPSAGLDAAALDTLCDWRFRPATLKGKPVEVYYSLTLNFEVRPR